MMRQVAAIVAVCTVTLLPAAHGFLQEEAVPVEPSELAKRDDLIDKKVAVDDHKAFYVQRNGSDPDELRLKRTDVTFLVPRAQRPQDPTRMTAALVRGILRRDGSKLVCDVTELKPVAGDLDRLERGIAAVGARDSETRKAWARWAERRARDFKNEALMKRARELEGEAFRIETGMKRLGVDAPQEWLAMAQDARRRKVPEPEPEALAHRAFRAKLATTPGEAELQTIVRDIEAFFPKASADRESGRANLARWEAQYADDPASAYRDAPATARKAFDRRLWADATERLINFQNTGDVAAGLAAAESARTLLPEKADLSTRLIEQAISRARQSLGTLRQSDVKQLAGVLKDTLNQPDQALAVLREWLEIRRGRLSDTDAEGPIALAGLYEELLGDKVTAVELLRKAWRIDPTSKEVVDAFRIRGFRKVQNEWVEVAPAADAPEKQARPTQGRTRGLIGLTPEEVRSRMGVKPDRTSYLGSKGQLIEQWIFLDSQYVRYVNLLHSTDDLKPRVVADYAIPRAKVKGKFGPP